MARGPRLDIPNAKAKGSPSCRRYALYDKVYRADVLEEAYKRCRRNGGAAGVDGQKFEDIEQYGEQQDASSNSVAAWRQAWKAESFTIAL